MFFVIFVEKIKEHLIIPTAWVRDPEITLQKFVNYSINSNQKHLIFYDKEAVENFTDVEPNFKLPIANQLASKCCYIAKIKKFFCK